MDVLAYSTLLITEQTRIMAELTRVVKNTPRFDSVRAHARQRGILGLWLLAVRLLDSPRV